MLVSLFYIWFSFFILKKLYSQYYLCILINDTFVIGEELEQRGILTTPCSPCSFFLFWENVIYETYCPITLFIMNIFLHLSQEDVK